MLSGVFFDGMKMPTCCQACPVVKRHGGFPFQSYSCGARPDLPDVYSAQAAAGRPEGCPAQEMDADAELSALCAEVHRLEILLDKANARNERLQWKLNDMELELDIAEKGGGDGESD